jgi:hypothetical protein
MDGTFNTHETEEKYIILIGKSEGRRSLEDFAMCGKDNIKEIG